MVCVLDEGQHSTAACSSLVGLKLASLSQWLNFVLRKNKSILKTDDHQVPISNGLGLGATICVSKTSHCDRRVNREALHLHKEETLFSLNCFFGRCRLYCHATGNSRPKEKTFGSLDLPPM